MPKRYVQRKKKRYSKKKYGKRKSKYGKRKRRYGGKRSRSMRSILKDSRCYTTIYKTACRVASRPSACAWYCLAPDPLRVQWRSNQPTDATEVPFTGDMTWRGPRDKVEAMQGVQQDEVVQSQGIVTMQNLTDSTYSGQGVISVQAQVNTDNNVNVMYNAPVGNLNQKPQPFTMSPNFNYVFGKNKYQLYIKSAVTGGNVNIELVKCVCRFDIPYNSTNENLRGQFNASILGNNISAITQMFQDQVLPARMEELLDSLPGWFQLGWSTYVSNGTLVPSETPGVQSATASTVGNRGAGQEGSTLYDNKLWCRLFKIQKSYKQELLPGQQAMINMKQKMSIMGSVSGPLNAQYLAKKGQIVYCLKIQGAIGHTVGTDGGFLDQNTVGTNRFYGGSSSRPSISLMAAAADVLCMKRLNVYVSQKKKKGKVKNIVTYNDYFDEYAPGSSQFATFVPQNINKYIDSAPSDYSATHAAIN